MALANLTCEEIDADVLEDVCQCCGKQRGERWAGAYEDTFACDDCAEALDRREFEYNNRRCA